MIAPRRNHSRAYKVEGVPPITTWDPEDVERHMEFQRTLGRELRESGELVSANGLAEEAKIAEYDGTGEPAVTDGPFPESKDLLAGYWIVDVESEDRAIEIAAEAARRRRESAAAGDPAELATPSPDEAEPDGDDTLTLLLLCCHPALTPQSAIALTLRGRRLDDGGDRARVPGARGHDGTADQPRRRGRSPRRAVASSCQPGTTGRAGSRRSCTCST